MPSRQYKVRDSLMGAVYKVGDEFPMLSQRSMHYFRRIAELVLAPVLADDHVHIKRVATAQTASFVKVAVRAYRNGEEVIATCKPLLYEFRTYTSRTIALVKYHTELEAYIREALAPAPSRSVRRVDVYREEHQARVIVERGTIAQFLGAQGDECCGGQQIDRVWSGARGRSGSGESRWGVIEEVRHGSWGGRRTTTGDGTA